MGATSPYLCQAPSRQSTALDPFYNFDPKAVTRASWSTVSTPRPVQNGPLINFNRHPDSYLIVPSAREDLPVLPSGTKQTIITARWIQFALRVLQLIGALGLLVCVICIKGIDDSQSWILRVPPAWDACISTYAIFHLFRPAKARTPMSSYSYHTFSLFMDLGLIPFMVMNALWSERNWSMATGSDGRWQSFFDADATNLLLLVTWILAIVVGGLHLISAGFDFYLTAIFRKIAQYPPDLNPLEDNLTSRAASRHKYKNSELSASVSEKKLTSMSGSTLALSRPNSQDAAKEKLLPDVNIRPVSFYHSRVNLDQTYSAHTKETARMSRANLYQQSNSSRASQSRSRSRSQSCSRSHGSRPNSSYLEAQGQHDPMPARPSSVLSAHDRPSRYRSALAAPQASVPTDVAKFQQKDSLLSDNWYVLGDDEQGDLSSPRRTPQPWARDLDDENDDRNRNPNAEQLILSKQQETDLLPGPLNAKAPSPPSHKGQLYPGHEDEDDSNDSNDSEDASSADHGAFYFSEMPLSAPVLDAYGNSHAPLSNDDDANSARNSEGTIGRALTITSAISAVSSLYSQTSTPDLSHDASPKRKQYGDLASATRSIRGFSPPEKNYAENGGRVVSRTGVDLHDTSVMYLDEVKTARGRQVSGKVVEEGMAGVRSSWWGGGVRKREVSGTA